jgi:carbamoyl-phosphate synthase small subunit
VTGSRRVLVTAQNHGFAVEPGDAAEVSHVSLNDGTVEGLQGDGFTTLQFHPEAAPGPHDALPFFDRIAEACRNARIYAAS